MKFNDIDTDYYLPGFFSIHMKNSKSLQDMFGNDNYEHRLFHEYLHFIQDITTTYGLINSSAIYNQIKDLYALVKYKKIQGDYNLIIPINEFSNSITLVNKKLINAYLFPEETEIENQTIEDIIPYFEEGIKLGSSRFDVTQYKVYFNDYHINFGAQAIYEGICHILESKIYNITINKFKAPYDLTYLIWKYYIPSEPVNYKAILDLSEFSLMFYNPSEIFINTLERIKNGEIFIVDNFYESLFNYWKSDSEENPNELFNKQYEACVNDINGVLKSEIYKEYKEWLLQELEIGSLFRVYKQPLFSKLLNFCECTKQEKTLWIQKQFFENIGYPPVFNDEGEVYFDKCTPEKANSMFYSQAIFNVYNCLVNGEVECELKENCLHINENNPNFEIDENCESSPWKRQIKDDYFCPFIAVLKTWGLLDMNIQRESKS